MPYTLLTEPLMRRLISSHIGIDTPVSSRRRRPGRPGVCSSKLPRPARALQTEGTTHDREQVCGPAVAPTTVPSIDLHPAHRRPPSAQHGGRNVLTGRESAASSRARWTRESCNAPTLNAGWSIAILAGGWNRWAATPEELLTDCARERDQREGGTRRRPRHRPSGRRRRLPHCLPQAPSMSAC